MRLSRQIPESRYSGGRKVGERLVDQKERVGTLFRQRRQRRRLHRRSGRIAGVADDHQIAGPDGLLQLLRGERESVFAPEREIFDLQPRPAAGGFVFEVARRDDQRPLRPGERGQVHQKFVGAVSGLNALLRNAGRFRQKMVERLRMRLRIGAEQVKTAQIVAVRPRRRSAGIEIDAEVEQLLRRTSCLAGEFR